MRGAAAGLEVVARIEAGIVIVIEERGLGTANATEMGTGTEIETGIGIEIESVTETETAIENETETGRGKGKGIAIGEIASATGKEIEIETEIGTDETDETAACQDVANDGIEAVAGDAAEVRDAQWSLVVVVTVSRVQDTLCHQYHNSFMFLHKLSRLQ